MDIYTHISPGLHPSNIERLDGYEEHKPYLNEALEAFSTGYEGINDIWKARDAAAKNPTMNDAGRLLTVAGFAEKKQNIITRKFDAAVSSLDKAIAGMESMLTEPLKQAAASGTIPQEIRAYVKSLKIDARNKFLADALNDGDVQTLQSVLGAPGYLSGLSEKERQIRTRLYHEHKSPETAARLKAVTTARDMLKERSQLLFDEFEKALGAKWDKVKQLREAKSQSDAAFVIPGIG
ncbi:MAG: hypothetical protein J5I92_12375 [Thiogranum sp.]|nr:hypothetical protein [Thiogranum sp.]